ncbi:MAG TPA: hypothetical protein VGH02_01450 [Rhizomicrobium sp.]|jgi:hypothetical protein
MAVLSLDLDELLLDLDNPRISKADSQRGAIQRIIDDQDVKLIVLAESIISDRLNPMDRWLVLKSQTERGRYIVLEGNRRLATLRILNNPAILDDLEVRAPVKRRFQELAKKFDRNAIGDIDCFEVSDRSDAATWLTQRHTGENKGRGIVNWGGVATARFRGRDPALQALDLVVSHGELSDEEKAAIEDRFPITTLDRLLSTPAVRTKIGVEISDSKLKSGLPAKEVIKPLRRMVLDLATGEKTVSDLKSRDQQVEYVSKFGKDLPDLSKKSTDVKSIDTLEDRDFDEPKPKPKPKPKTKPQPIRRNLIPRDCTFSVTNSKIAEIVKELRSLLLDTYPHSISVLFRVFLEQSTDHYLSAAGIPLTVTVKNHTTDKRLRYKVDEAVKHMIKNGATKKDLIGITKALTNEHSPLHPDTLNNYVHNRFFSPTERDLKVAWDNAQRYFETIWK